MLARTTEVDSVRSRILAGPRFLGSQTKLTFFGRPFRGPVNLISSFGIPRQRHPQPDSQTPRAFYLVPTFGGLPAD